MAWVMGVYLSGSTNPLIQHQTLAARHEKCHFFYPIQISSKFFLPQNVRNFHQYKICDKAAKAKEYTKKGTQKQFDSAGEIQIWKDVYPWFFFQFLCHRPQKNESFFLVLFVALSHCDKQKLSKSH